MVPSFSLNKNPEAMSRAFASTAKVHFCNQCPLHHWLPGTCWAWLPSFRWQLGETDPLILRLVVPRFALELPAEPHHDAWPDEAAAQPLVRWCGGTREKTDSYDVITVALSTTTIIYYHYVFFFFLLLLHTITYYYYYYYYYYYCHYYYVLLLLFFIIIIIITIRYGNYTYIYIQAG